MKKIIYSLFAVSLAMLSGCQDDATIVEEPAVPAQTGDEITFGPSLDKLQTRTIYDDEPQNGAYRVIWEAGDQVSIYCPEASNATLVNYTITPDMNDPTTSSAVTKVNTDEAGLQWGTAETHHFYGFYPASRVTGTENGRIRCNIPTTQNVDSWKIQPNDNGGTTYYGKTNTELSYMWAYGEFNKSTMGGKDVPLTFHPWMTVLELHIPGPVSGSLTISNINIRATEGTQTMLAGDFICDMTPVIEGGSGATPNYEAVSGQEGEVTNTISISGYNAETDEFITLNSPNDEMVVRAYLLPIDEQNATNARNIQVSVATADGGAALTRTLGWSGAGENSIVPHKVNTVILPPVINTGTNYWMSSLDRDVYLSEVSWPGSKFSYLTAANGANPVYQGATISQQFLDGVRAFIVQCRAEVTYNATRTQTGDTGWPIYAPVYEYSYEYSDATLSIEGGGGQVLANTIEDIAAGLQEAETELGVDRNLECAVVMVTYSGAGGVSVNFTGNPERGANINTVGGADNVWMDAIQHELIELSTDGEHRINTEEITPNTTLADVAGKIIFKVNYNTDAQANHMLADAGTPALFSMWDGTMNTVPLRWGSANPDVQNTLQWMYHEATHVGSDTEITWVEKQNEIRQVFTNSVETYQNNAAHNIWFMVDCGGTYYEGSESNQNVINLTNDLNPIVERVLQTRTENASTGLVFFNFADKQENSGVLYGTNTLIQTIIDNNFKFNLRKAGSSTGGSTTQNRADGSYTAGGSVWQ